MLDLKCYCTKQCKKLRTVDGNLASHFVPRDIVSENSRIALTKRAGSSGSSIEAICFVNVFWKRNVSLIISVRKINLDLIKTAY